MDSYEPPPIDPADVAVPRDFRMIDTHVHWWDHAHPGVEWGVSNRGWQHPRLMWSWRNDQPRFAAPEYRTEAAGLFAERHPEMVDRLALDATVWTGEGSPTLAERRKKLPEFISKNRRPIDRSFVHSIFNRDHPGTAEDSVINAFADAIVKLDDSVPTGTYVDMCSKLPVNNPENIKVPTIVMRGQWDGIAGFDDLIEFFKRLPNPDKQFAVMPGIAHASLQQRNYALVLHILHSFFSQPEPVYRAEH